MIKKSEKIQEKLAFAIKTIQNLATFHF